MSANVFLATKFQKTEGKRIKIDNLDLDSKVYLLRERASENLNRPTKEIELVFGGVQLHDDHSLSSYGIKSGRTIFVLEPVQSKVIKPGTKEEHQKIIDAFVDFHNKSSLLKVAQLEVINEIVAAHPQLVDDPPALALLQDPELMIWIGDEAVMRKILEVHPRLVAPFTQLVNYVRDNPTALTSSSTTATGYAYSLDALSDDDDMDAGDAQPREANPLSRNSSYNSITAAQLAAAIASATTNFSSTGAVVNNTPSPPTSAAAMPAAGSTPIITNEMFGNALQQAFVSAHVGNHSNSVATPATSRNSLASTTPSNNSSNGEESMESIRARLEPQLEQMRDMGLVNETQNIRALQVTSGDVQAAIELVFNGTIDMSF